MNQLKAGTALNYVSIVLHMVVGLIYTPFGETLVESIHILSVTKIAVV